MMWGFERVEEWIPIINWVKGLEGKESWGGVDPCSSPYIIPIYTRNPKPLRGPL